MANNNLATLKPYTAGLILIGIFNLLIALGRLYFAVSGIHGGMEQFLDVPISQVTSIFLLVMFFALGICGLVATFGFLRLKSWGISAIFFVSTTTIIFDIWGCTIQATAAMGFVVPILSLLYLLTNRNYLLQELKAMKVRISHMV